ncbi:MAG: hypothetical protein WBJ83_00135 [Thermacetogeniaceae bacterium]|jgi:transposase|nr:helix-turn-helix domain-containing protein [Syntrophomonadaceae bacterium]
MSGFGPPWSLQPSLQLMLEEAGLDIDRFLDDIRKGKTDDEIAQQTGVSKEVISSFREHFEKYGIDSVMGQD